jgi:hypothetical protein
MQHPSLRVARMRKETCDLDKVGESVFGITIDKLRYEMWGKADSYVAHLIRTLSMKSCQVPYLIFTKTLNERKKL